jgi:hypothetical protein
MQDKGDMCALGEKSDHVKVDACKSVFKKNSSFQNSLVNHPLLTQ